MSDSAKRFAVFIRRAGAVAVIGGLICGLAAAMWAVGVSNASEAAVVRATFTPILAVLVGTIFIVNAASINRGRCIILSNVTLATTVVVAAGWLAWIWGWQDLRHESFFIQLIGAASTVTIGLAVVCQLLAAEPRTYLARFVTKSFAIWVSIYALWLAAFICSTWLQDRGELFGPPTVVAGVLTVCMLLVVRVMLTWKPAAQKKETLSNRPRLRMACPKCEYEHVYSAGAARCLHCRLVMMIEIQEPRCECGYLLYQLKGDTCPECGRSINSVSRPVAVTPDQTPAQ